MMQHADTHFYEPASGHGLTHDPIGSIVGPRPIGWISTRDRNENLNLAPYSFFNIFSYSPPVVAFSSVGYKDTVRNAEETGEFVCNLVTRGLAAKMNETSVEVDALVDEFELARLTPLRCQLVRAPRVGESPVSLECGTTDVIRLRDKGGNAINSWMAMGEVVGVHINRAYLTENTYVTDHASPILRGGSWGDYFEINQDIKFQMRRPG